MTPAQVRAQAASILASLLKQRGSLATLLPRPAAGSEPEEGQALLRELCFGTCRWFYQLDAQLANLLDKPLRAKDADIHCLLLLGLYQLQHLRLPDYAAINETVNAAVVLKKVWAKRLVNGVLRRWQREHTKGDSCIGAALLESDEAIAASYPEWLRTAVGRAWPEQATDILRQGNLHPPMTLRVNREHGTRDHYLAALQSAGFEANAGTLSDSAIYLQRAVSVHALPGFADGAVSVQDEASQLIPSLLDPQAGDRVLDACAAPGGKTAHLLEWQPGLQSLVALDSDKRRLERLYQNLDRLQLRSSRVSVACADASYPQDWWDGQAFDRILVDAPCSATGIIRRQPDIKVLRQPEDLITLVELQSRLLDALWSCLAPGGTLLYTTCSILPAENADQISAFLARTTDARVVDILPEHVDRPWAARCPVGKQLLPSKLGPDGFYYALLMKHR